MATFTYADKSLSEDVESNITTVFVTVDPSLDREVSDSDIPVKYWNEIADECRKSLIGRGWTKNIVVVLKSK